MTGVALFGSYPAMPAAIRNHGRQPGFAGGHCVWLQPATGYVPPFLDEFSHEPGVVADCVPATGVRGVNYETWGAQGPCWWAEREALQEVMPDPTPDSKPGTQDEGADESQLAGGIRARYGLTVAHGQSWPAIVAAIGAVTTPVRLGDPLATSDYLGAKLGDLRAFAAGLGYRYVLFPQLALRYGLKGWPAYARTTVAGAQGYAYRIFVNAGKAPRTALAGQWGMKGWPSYARADYAGASAYALRIFNNDPSYRP